MSVILMTTLFYKALILQGEIWCWPLLGLKGLKMAGNKNKNAIWALLLSLLALRTTLQQNYKQLLDEVFVISGIIKIEVSIICRAEGRGW